MYNKVIMMGNLTRDVELRYLPSGSALATIGLASNRRFKKQDGSQGEEVCFVDVKLFGRTAEVANQYLRKGSRVLIEGRLTLETWNDQSGAKRSKHTITAENMQMLDSRSSSEDHSYESSGMHNGGGYGASGSDNAYGQSAKTQAYGGNSGGNNYSQNVPEINIDDEDLPF